MPSNAPVSGAGNLIPGSEVSPGFELHVRGTGYEGFAVVDTLVEGRSSGGVRITDDLAVDEVRALAREMTHKYALFLLPRGGAKAGVRLDAELSGSQRLDALQDFGRKLAPIIRAGLYYPGMDMNCGPDELRAIYRGVGQDLGAHVTDTSWFTAMTVQHALEATVESQERKGSTTRLAIEGFGRVARHLVSRLDPARFRVVALATVEGGVVTADGFDSESLLEAKDRFGDAMVRHLPGEAIDRGEVLAAEADIVLPSSRTWVLGPDLARRVRARAVVPISNAPYVNGSELLLHERGCVALPGFLSNVGGVLASSLHDLGVPDPRIEELLREHYRPIVDAMLERSAERRQPLTEFAVAVADEHARHRPPYAPPRGLFRKVLDRVGPRPAERTRRRNAEQDFLARCAQLLDELRTPGFPS